MVLDKELVKLCQTLQRIGVDLNMQHELLTQIGALNERLVVLEVIKDLPNTL